MFSSLIEIDKTVDVIYDGVIRCLESDRNSLYRDISPGSQGERILDLIQILLSMNPSVVRYKNSTIVHSACKCLRGNLFLAVLKLFTDENSESVKCISQDGRLPIHCAASHSSMDVLQFLHKTYPESLAMVVLVHEENLLHLALDDTVSDSADKIAKVKYLCDQRPDLMHMENSLGLTPLVRVLILDNELDVEAVKVLCDADETVVSSRCTFASLERLPLHYLIVSRFHLISELSKEGDCFRLFLRLYPASADTKDGRGKSPYDWAVEKELKPYFIRLLLSADPTIDPVQRSNLNFSARREGVFLAFRALSTDVEPSIWSKIRYKNKKLLAHVMSYL